jgi:predicted small integral membrane protein
MDISMRRRARIFIGLLGVAFVSVYLTAALGLVKDVDKLLLVLVFAIGPAAIAWSGQGRAPRHGSGQSF